MINYNLNKLVTILENKKLTDLFQFFVENEIDNKLEISEDLLFLYIENIVIIWDIPRKEFFSVKVVKPGIFTEKSVTDLIL